MSGRPGRVAPMLLILYPESTRSLPGLSGRPEGLTFAFTTPMRIYICRYKAKLSPGSGKKGKGKLTTRYIVRDIIHMCTLDMFPLDMFPLDMFPLDMFPLDMFHLDMLPLDMFYLDMFTLDLF